MDKIYSIHKGNYVGILESWTLHDFMRHGTCVDKSQVYDGYI